MSLHSPIYLWNILCFLNIVILPIKPNYYYFTKHGQIINHIKSRFGVGETKHLFFTTNYLLEDEGSNIGFLGSTMSMELDGDLIQEGINEKIDIKQIQQERPNLKVIPYAEIEKAQFEVTRFVVNLEIKAPSFTPKYVLGAKKYADQFQDKIRSLLEPKIGDRFIIK